MAERMDHDAMRRETPQQRTPAAAHEPEPIPGEHDHSTEMPTQPGIVGTTGYGGDVPPETIDSSLNDEERRLIRWENGGRVPNARGHKPGEQRGE
jgi:hypothetical protein